MSLALHCRGVAVEYGETSAVRSLDLVVDQGHTVALLGPSGSGKSTLLYAIAGFVDVAGGSIEIDGHTVSTTTRSVAPERRSVGLVFQNYALWPHLTAADTVAYPMRRTGVSKREARARAHALLEMLAIDELADRKPGEMSGGQQQRVGLARALAREARLYLFDEPTAHLDASVRAAVQEEVGRRSRQTGAGSLYATHDSSEALAIADQIVLLRDGSAVQAAPPRTVYERPVDVWAARLTGPAVVIEVEAIRSGEGKVEVGLAGGRVIAETDAVEAHGRLAMIVRPEWVGLGGPTEGRVREAWFRGSHTDYRIETAAGELYARLPGPPRVGVGESSAWSIDRGWVPSGSGSGL